jgi:hypothetical protein
MISSHPSHFAHTKETPVPIEWEADGRPQSQSGHYVEEVNLLPLLVYICITASGKVEVLTVTFRVAELCKKIYTLVPVSIQFNLHHTEIGNYKIPETRGLVTIF